MKHKSVMTKEVISSLEIKEQGIYLDLTYGAGGHSKEILERGGKVIAFEADSEAIKNVDGVEQLKNRVYQVKGKDLTIVNDSFIHLEKYLQELGVEEVNGVLADLGWSTDQLETIPGLSYKQPEHKLDMRMHDDLGVSAADILNAFSKKELSKLFDKYADIRSKPNTRLVDEIIKARGRRKFSTVADLMQVIESAFSPALHRGSGESQSNLGLLPARVFQALRIVVNNELSSLQSMLPQAWRALRVGGILVVITFHSGEERVVREWGAEEKAEYIYKQKFLRPSVDELRQNLAARSAKLWAMVKTEK